MKKIIAVMIVVLFFILSLANGEILGGIDIDKNAMIESMFPDRPKDHDFAKIPAYAEYKQDELIVSFMPKTNGKHRTTSEKDVVISALGGGSIKTSYGFSESMAHIKLPKGLTVSEALKRYNGRKEILFAQPNYRYKLVGEPNDTYWNDLWGIEKIHAPDAWDVNTSSSGVVVAVIDSGVDYTHEDLSANMWVNEVEFNGTPGVDDDNNLKVDDIYGYDFCGDRDGDPMDEYGHGTHVSGTIGAVGNNGTGVTGVCWGAQIMALRVLDAQGHGYTSDMLAAVWYARLEGADVGNMSVEGDDYDGALRNHMKLAIKYNNMLFVCAAGNSDRDTDTEPIYPACFDLNGIISVMATTSTDYKASYSNYGEVSVDLGAPGTGILSCAIDDDYAYNSGTSMASPHVAGACALLCSEYPSLTNLQIKDLVLDNVDDVNSLYGDCVTGGRVNLEKAMLIYQIENVTQGTYYNVLKETIQDAIDDAVTGDTILLPALTYNEKIDFDGKAITIRSRDPNDPNVVASTIINGGASGNVVTFDSSEGNNSVLKGITITGGSRGIYCYNTSPTISGCVISGISGSVDGAGMYCKYGSPIVENCTFSGNIAGRYGGAIECLLGSVTVTDCLFYDNNTTDSSYGSGGAIDIANATSAVISNCTFSSNHSNYRGGGVYNYHSSPDFYNCIFWDNTADSSGGEIYNELSAGDDVFFSYSDIEGGLNGSKCGGDDSTDGGNNINSDPCFVDSDSNDFHLLGSSPCINVSDPNGDYDDRRDLDDEPRVMGGKADIGVDEYCGVSNLEQNEWYDDIQDAIDDANSDTTIEVGPGIYTETIDFNGMAITVTGVEPKNRSIVEATIIDGGTSSYAVRFDNNEDSNSLLKGVTVQKGSPSGIYCNGASPIISDCIIDEDDAGAMCIHINGNSAAKITDCLILRATARGGGIQCFEGSPTIERCLFEDHGRYGAICCRTSATIQNNVVRNSNFGILLQEAAAVVRNNLIYECDGQGTYEAGIVIRDSNLSEVVNNTIVSNNVGIKLSSGTQPIITNCILWGNNDDLYDCNATYSCIEDINDANGTGNTTSDPCFVDFYSDDFHLDSESSCINAGDPNGSYTGQLDIDGDPRVIAGRVDIGVDEVRGVHNLSKDIWYTSINDAIDNADANDEIVVYEGTYYESVDFDGKAITVRSSDPNDANVVAATVIDANGGNYGVEFSASESSSSVLKGFTITGAASRGIFCDDASPTITDCNITANYAGMKADNSSSANVSDCIFHNNTRRGMYIDDSDTRVVDCVFTKNNRGGMDIYSCSPEIINCVFYDNTTTSDGGGMYIENPGDVNIINCTFYDNYTGDDGGGIYCYDGTTIYIRNCILWNNQADDSGGEVYNSGCDVYVYHSCIEGEVNGDKCGGDSLEDESCNTDEDPDFADDSDPDGSDGVWCTSDDGLVPTCSSCDVIDGGDNSAVSGIDEDIKGDARIINGDVDMGAYEYDD